MAKPFELFLSGDEIRTLEEQDIIVRKSETVRASDSFVGVNRARSWMAKCDCAILSGWRGENPRKVNDENNREILRTLMEKGYGLCRCRGYYPESGKEIKVENSFFVFDKNHTGKAFFELIRSLAEHYHQDSFLFIEGGSERPFLFGTNVDFGIGRTVPLGKICFKAKESDSFTRFRGNVLAFKDESDS